MNLISCIHAYIVNGKKFMMKIENRKYFKTTFIPIRLLCLHFRCEQDSFVVKNEVFLCRLI